MSKLDSKKKTLIIVGVIAGVTALLAAGVHFLKSIAEEFEGDDDYYGYDCCDDCGVCEDSCACDGSCADGNGSCASEDPPAERRCYVEPIEPATPADPGESE